MVHHELEEVYGKRPRQTKTGNAPPMRRRADSGKRRSPQFWGIVGDLFGFTLIEMISPVAGLVVMLVSSGLASFGALCDLFRYATRARDRRKGKTKK